MAYNNYDGYGYDTSQDESYYDDTSQDESYDDDLEQCRYCPSQVKRSNYYGHIERVHTCDECGHSMPQKSLQGHKDRKHMETCNTCGVKMLTTPMKQHLLSHYMECKYCKKSVHEQNMKKHIQDNHPFHATVGMICLDKLTDAEFNKLVAANRIYSKDGHLFERL